MRTDTRYIAWTPATDTTELPSVLRGCPPTTELHLLDLRPPVRARYQRPPSRLAAHIRDSIRSAFWPLAIGAGVIEAVLLIGAR